RHVHHDDDVDRAHLRLDLGPVRAHQQHHRSGAIYGAAHRRDRQRGGADYYRAVVLPAEVRTAGGGRLIPRGRPPKPVAWPIKTIARLSLAGHVRARRGRPSARPVGHGHTGARTQQGEVTMKGNARRAAIASMLAPATMLVASTAALAQAPAGKIDPADTAWMIAANGLVFLLSIPGRALFYCGVGGRKEVTAPMSPA